MNDTQPQERDIVERLNAEIAAQMRASAIGTPCMAIREVLEQAKDEITRLRAQPSPREPVSFRAEYQKLFNDYVGAKAMINEQRKQIEHLETMQSAVVGPREMTLEKALRDIRQELWVDYCLRMGRTDTDPRPFNSKPHIRVIDAALSQASDGHHARKEARHEHEAMEAARRIEAQFDGRSVHTIDVGDIRLVARALLQRN